MSIIDDLILFENYLYKSNKHDYIYKELKKSENNIEKIYNSLKKNSKYLKRFKQLDFIKKNIDNTINSYKIKFNYIKEDDIFYIYISIFILLSVNNSMINLDTESNKIKTSHQVYNSLSSNFQKIIIFWLIKLEETNYSFSKNNLLEISAKIINILIFDKILKDKNVSEKNKIIKYIYIENLEYFNINQIYEDEFTHIRIGPTYWLFNETFWSIKKIFKENDRSNYVFNLGDKDLLNKMCKNYFYIDIEYLEDIYDIFLKYNGIEKNNINSLYIEAMEKYKSAIYNNIIKSKISREISLYIKCFMFDNIIKNYKKDKKYYIPFMLDFRGRKYDIAQISPTFFSEMRYCIHKGYYDEIDEIKNHELSQKINSILIDYTKNINELNDYEDKISYIWLMVSLAEPFKSKMGKNIKLDCFVRKGIYVFKNKDILLNLKYDDRIKCEYIIKVLNEMIEKKKIKRLIPKDATASVFQHLVKILGNSNDKSLHICNLSNTFEWNDPYAYIIEDFNKRKDLNILDEDKKNKFFTRTNLKKIMMTVFYGCSLWTAKKYFMENIKEDYNKLNEEEKNDIKITFTNFYKYIYAENVIIKENPQEIIKFFEKNKKIIFNDQSDTNFTYFRIVKSRKDTTINGNRYTYIQNNIDKEEDSRKFMSSIVANYIQSQDASLVRWVLSKDSSIITIHDCFMIDYKNITYLISLINEGMNQNFHSIKSTKKNNIFSIFILI